MSFEQFKIERYVDQTRKIFDKYIYKTDDHIGDVTAPGYFDECRFKDNPDWPGSFIDVLSADGYVRIRIESDGDAGTVISKAANEIIINSIDDFSVQDATTITLEEGFSYVQGALISTPKRFIVEPNVSVVSDSPGENVLWECTAGSGAMFTGVDVGFFNGSGMSVRCPGMEVFNFSDVAVLKNTIFNLNLFIAWPEDAASQSCSSIGTFTSISALDIVNSSAFRGTGLDRGITLGGAEINIISIQKLAILSNSATYVGLDLGTTVVQSAFEISNFVNIGLAAGSIGFLGLPSSGNVSTSIIATYVGCEFLGAITPLSGLSGSDLRHDFLKCPPVPDSTKAADAFLTAAQTVTIGAGNQGVYFPIGGALFQRTIEERFSVSTAGVATYTSPVQTKCLVLISATVEKSGGGSNRIAMVSMLNGTETLRTVASTENSAPTSLTSIGLYTLNELDELQPAVSNLDGTSDVIVSSCIMTIINGF